MDKQPSSGMSMVTVCKGRLPFLQQALLTWVALGRELVAEVVVVTDGGSEGDEVANWIAGLGDERVRLVRADGDVFRVGVMRNAGIKGGKGEWVLLIDCDVCVDRRFGEVVRRAEVGKFYQAYPMASSLGGTVLVERAALEAIGGYDELFEGWGEEDVDLLRRLELVGVKRYGFEAGLLRHIDHGDDLRVRFHAEKNLARSAAINAAYSRLRAGMIRMTGKEVPEDIRKMLYSKVKEAAYAGEGKGGGQVAVTVEKVPIGDMEVEVGVVVRVGQRKS